MTIDYPALKTELETDPVGYGYAPFVANGSDNVLAEMLNTVRAGTDGFPAITVRRADIRPSEVLEAVDVRDFVANPSVAWTSWFESATRLDAMRLLNDDGTDTLILKNLKRILTDTNGSQARVVAICNRNGSRAEQLFGTGTLIRDSDVAQALRG